MWRVSRTLTARQAPCAKQGSESTSPTDPVTPTPTAPLPSSAMGGNVWRAPLWPLARGRATAPRVRRVTVMGAVTHNRRGVQQVAAPHQSASLPWRAVHREAAWGVSRCVTRTPAPRHSAATCQRANQRAGVWSRASGARFVTSERCASPSRRVWTRHEEGPSQKLVARHNFFVMKTEGHAVTPAGLDSFLLRFFRGQRLPEHALR